MSCSILGLCLTPSCGLEGFPAESTWDQSSCGWSFYENECAPLASPRFGCCMNDLGSVPTGAVCSVSFQSMYTKGLADAMGVKVRPLEYGIHLCFLQGCLLFAYTPVLEIQQRTQLV